ncbi:beta-galactosidase [Mucilaginibacter gossypiicola]|uniref:Beta-galactosidase n=1 Tax=Mucilaginibacter gossypiicola TaxID=551995 RepID=A0A1H8HQS6_9SPHI|nr:beta-galactosidase [Mucilaginibacter gossypiicola]SEN58501.1 beta-galactosidase [Mucilaginibacter gossypiicola]
MRIRYSILTFILLLSAFTKAHSQSANDHIFPASAVAKPYIDFDSKGFMVNGKRTFIVSAGLEYARIPHELWYDRLLRIKRAGFNCIEIYTIWNFHEEQEGKFNFTGDHDLGKFLDIVKQLGLYAIVRVGPYYCAEWDNGGYPIWLKFKKGLRVREDNKSFEQYVDRFFDHLLPVVFQRQINKGGAVILVQLENEHPNGWGTVMPDGYFKHLQAKALDMGMQVPYFFSGLHHASDPAGDGKLDDDKRPNPWFSTEFWAVWYSQYGAKPGDAELYDRRTWKIIARGGNGYNYYMAHGGSNFGYTNNDEDAASYDYGTGIGQAGDLRPIYYAFKRAAWFSRSFQDVLENSTNASETYKGIAVDTAIKISARTSPAGDLIFLDNPGTCKLSTPLDIKGAEELLAGKTISVQPKEIFPLVHNYKLNDDVTLDWVFTRVFAIVKQANTITVVVDAEAGNPLLLRFNTKDKASSKSTAVKIGSNDVLIDEKMPVANEMPVEYTFTSGPQTIRVLAMNRALTDKTWITETEGKSYIITGLNYVGETSVKSGQFKITAETPLTQKSLQKAILYTDSKGIAFNIDAKKGGQQQTINLSNWQYKNAAVNVASNVSTSTWLKSKDPQPIGADADVTADAWYRAMLNIPSNGKYTLQVKGGGRGQAFIDGKPAAKWKLNDNELTLNLTKGKHTLAVFAAHDGRDKLAAYLGPIDEVDSKGLFGNALIKKGGPFISELGKWYFTSANKKDDVKQGPPAFDTSVYKKYKIGNDVFNLKEGYAWFHTIIPQQAVGTSKLAILFKSVDENATVFINGKQVAHHDGWNQPFEVNITDAETLKRPVELTVFIENYSNEGGIDQPVKINAIGDATTVTNWQLKGGPGDVLASTGWTKPDAAMQMKNEPVFYRTTFSLPPSKGNIFIWRFEPEGLGHGSVWVNGHNLGRYPEKLDVKSLYIPECWLKTGLNQLVVYDEDGNSINQTRIVAEEAAGRTINEISIPLN